MYRDRTEMLDRDDRIDFDRRIVAPPGKEPPPRSRGTGALMAAFRMGGR